VKEQKYPESHRVRPVATAMPRHNSNCTTSKGKKGKKSEPFSGPVINAGHRKKHSEMNNTTCCERCCDIQMEEHQEAGKKEIVSRANSQSSDFGGETGTEGQR